MQSSRENSRVACKSVMSHSKKTNFNRLLNSSNVAFKETFVDVHDCPGKSFMTSKVANMNILGWTVWSWQKEQPLRKCNRCLITAVEGSVYPWTDINAHICCSSGGKSNCEFFDWWHRCSLNQLKQQKNIWIVKEIMWNSILINNFDNKNWAIKYNPSDIIAR